MIKLSIATLIVLGTLIFLVQLDRNSVNYASIISTDTPEPSSTPLTYENLGQLLKVRQFDIESFDGFDTHSPSSIRDIEWIGDTLLILTDLGVIRTSACLDKSDTVASDMPLLNLKILSPSTVIASTRDGRIVELNFTEDRQTILAQIEGVGLFTDFEIVGDRQWLLAAEDSVYVFDMSDWTLAAEIESINYEISDISLDMAKMRLAVISYQAIEIFDISDVLNALLVYSNTTLNYTGDEVKFLTEDEIIIGAHSRLSFVDIPTEEATILENLDIDSRDMDLNPSGTLLAVNGGYAGTIELWNPTNKTLVSTLSHSQEDEADTLKGFVHGVEFSPDGQYLATTSLSRLIIWGIKESRNCN